MADDAPSGTEYVKDWRRFVRVAAVLIVLFAPVAAIVLLRNSEQHFRTLPVMGEREALAPGDTAYHTLPVLDSLQAQNGAPWGLDSLRGRMHVADFFFTYCPGVCRKLSQGMQELQPELAYAWQQTGDVRMVSYSIDPARDSLPRLQAYARQFKAQPGLWTFVRGPQAQIAKAAKQGYLLPLQFSGGAEDGFTHSEMLVLVDPDLRVRGFYNGLDKAERKRLLDEVKVLRHEYRKKQVDTGKYPRFATNDAKP